MSHEASHSPRWGVALLNMGGPANTEQVRPFLYNLLSDPHIIGIPIAPVRRMIAARISRKRAPLVIPRYQAIGGGSPILEQTRAQAAALQQQLSVNNYPVVIAMRYSEPRAEDAVKQLVEQGVEHVVALPLYPHASHATTESSLKDFTQAAAKAGLGVHAVGAYPTLPGYIDAMANEIDSRLPYLNNPTVIFSAHGLPQRAVNKGDPYPEHIEQTVQALIERLPEGVAHRLAFQSRLGPVRWLQPYLDETVREVAATGNDLLLVPVSFVSEHIETLYELDVEVRELAKQAGSGRFERIPTVQTDAGFIAGLAELVRKTIENADKDRA